MKLTTLNYFVTVATEGNFTRASEKLYISQPTLSRRIQNLESELGVELFIRHNHGLTLSDAGEQFLKEVSDVLKRIDHLSHMFDHQVNSDEAFHIFKIGYLQNFNMGKMYEIFEYFKNKHPNVQFVTKQDTPINLADGLSNGRYDLVFNLVTYLQTKQNIEKSIFLENYLQIAVPFHHILNDRKKVSFADLSSETFILLERQYSPVIVDYVIGQGIKNGFNLKANSYVKDLDEGLSRVSVGNDLAFLYSGMNDGTLEEKYHIKIIDIDNVSTDHTIAVAYNKEYKNELLQELFMYYKTVK
ncbi:DNA-binding transcriptional LysR family regulator [Enterococcus rotai]|uniref:LysR family transcriptional regulator n=1 Tax=Enterococcus rotai TaxID=118060 RepID=UPI0033915EFA